MAEQDDELRRTVDDLVRFMREHRTKKHEIKVYSPRSGQKKARLQRDEGKTLDDLLKKVEKAARPVAEPAVVPETAPPAGKTGVASVDGTTASEQVTPHEIVPIDRFFSFVASGVINAQTELDRRSEQYLADTAKKKYLPPTVFRLPKVTGEIKFGLNEVKEQGLNLLFFQRGKKHEQFQQHSLRFEIVSAPPALDTVRELQDLAFGVAFRITPASRAPILARLSAAVRAQNSISGALPENLLATLRAAPHTVLALEPSTGLGVYFIGIYTEAGTEHLFVWALQDTDDKPVLACVLKVATTDVGAARLKPLLEMAFRRQQQVHEALEQLSPGVNG